MTEQTPSPSYGSSYGKKPLWQWILIYVLIGGVVYGLIYYFVFAKKGGSGYSYNYTAPSPANTQSAAPTAMTGGPTSSNIYTTKTSSTKGKYMADFQGNTVYVFDKDTAGVSTCYGGCAQVWPAYSSGATAQSTLPANITVVKRTDGTSQFAWKGRPLYYYAPDQKPGDTTGDGVGGVWHIVKLP